MILLSISVFRFAQLTAAITLVPLQSDDREYFLVKTANAHFLLVSHHNCPVHMLIT